MKLGWIDFSESDRRRALDVIHSLEDGGAMDELGLGVIRDGFSNIFFPGTSTVQTRAKYFFICPYAIEDACRNKRNTDVRQILAEIDNTEKYCAKTMKENAEDTETGIIGSTKLPQWVVRKPYSIYWNGLKTYGILKENISIGECARYYIELNNQKDNTIIGKAREDDIDNTGDDEDAGKIKRISFWNVPYHKDWKDNLKIELTKEEAEFLKEQIEASCGNYLIGKILANNIDIRQIESFDALCEIVKPFVDEELKNTIQLARDFSNFSLFIGAAYNRFLLGEDKVKTLWDQIVTNKEKYLIVDLDSVFTTLGLKHYSKMYKFLSDIKSELRKDDFGASEKVLIEQERKLKTPAKAKLLNKEKYQSSNWVGLGKLDYRFWATKNILSDIYNSLND